MYGCTCADVYNYTCMDVRATTLINLCIGMRMVRTQTCVQTCVQICVQTCVQAGVCTGVCGGTSCKNTKLDFDGGAKVELK